MTRSRPDSCPGALQLHQAADGPLARIRLPGGYLAPAQLQLLADAARELGNSSIECTARGNVQLRAVTDAVELAARLQAAGLLPSATHERVRNILASPLSGRVGGLLDVRPLVGEFDARLQSAARLAELPARVLFSFDDGRGDVTGLAPDIGLHADGPDRFALILAGTDTGVRFGEVEAVDVMLEAAVAFAELRHDEWRLAELPNGIERVLDAIGLEPTDQTVTFGTDEQPPIGWFAQRDGRVALGAGIKLGSLDARTAEFFAAVERPIIVTPWRSLVLCDLDEWTAEQVVRVLAPMGVIFDADSPWLSVSACTGRPGCGKALADVRADLTEAIESGDLPVEGRQHWVGCERGCGRPRGDVSDVVAGPDGAYVTFPRSDRAQA